jgi:hypothetical protein
MGTPVEHGNWTTAIPYDRNGDSMASIVIPLTIPPEGIVPSKSSHRLLCGGNRCIHPLAQDLVKNVWREKKALDGSSLPVK